MGGFLGVVTKTRTVARVGASSVCHRIAVGGGEWNGSLCYQPAFRQWRSHAIFTGSEGCDARLRVGLE